ncbi:hypothetical protein EMPS_07174 [Entomortierella parvispora]|uniref:Zn(2)-C6 fungal-type domain-containing protein n=1 Tax=Entomortierella parvispora TaxID=205924 RepID=A0A9P3LXY0_9FUNG|nr:hypothetical protein EMPS_07174 [Entomortierella parvispora]
MADNKRLRVSKACDSCRRKKVKCDALHPLCTNCQTFNYECTYNDPTKKRGPPKGYIEAIEARLHRMEGLLGGLVKDKDPRAEIVRAELDAMAREAEMTGLKLRRSKAYEEINHAMTASSASSSSGPGSSSASALTSTSTHASSSTVKTPHQVQAGKAPVRQHQQSQQHYQNQNQSHIPHQHQHHHQQHSYQHHHSHHGSATSSQNASSGRPSMTQHGASSHHRPPQNEPVPTSSQGTRNTSGGSFGYQGHPQEHSGYPQPQHHQYSHRYPAHGQSHQGQTYPPQYSSSPYSQNSMARQDHQPLYSHQDAHRAHSSSGYGSAVSPPMHHIKQEEPRPMSGLVADNSQNMGYQQEHYQVSNDHRQSTSGYTSYPPPNNSLTGYMPLPKENVALVMPSPDVIDHLLKVHFRFVHPVLPMLHYKTLSDQIHRHETPQSHLIFAILGLSSRFSDDAAFRTPQPGADRPPCTIFYERAKYFIKEEYDNSQLGTVQALLLMAIQQMGFCENQRAWLYVGMAIRMAQDLGLNKELSEQEQSRNRLLAEMRRRTWWSCYVVERLVCAGLGRPLTITHKECETALPQYDDDEGNLPEMKAVVGRPTVVSNFVHLITLSKIQGHILEFIKARAIQAHNSSNEGGSFSPNPNLGSDQEREPRIDTSQNAFFSLDKALTTWRQNLPESLQNPTADSPHFGLFIHLTYNTLIILLHRPEVPSSATSASLCTQAAATITDIVEILMDAKALTSMFISCLYAIFSAGLIHFMNIPSVKRSTNSATSSPTMAHTRVGSPSHTHSAKTNLKRCIDALKFLASHWVSAARRAKVLEDLLDLKHVSLKDLEADSFKTVPLEPEWAVNTTGYNSVLVIPREGHDKLRQQCRSKMMAIHSLLADDDDYDRMQQRRGFSMDQDEMSEQRMESSVDEDRDQSMDVTMDNYQSPSGTDKGSEIKDGGLRSPPTTSSSAVSSPNTNRSDQKTMPVQFDADPMMLISTANLGFSDSPAVAAESDHQPVTMAAMDYQPQSSAVDSSGESHMNGSVSANPATSGANAGAQVTMLDPFSMPSSITFPDHGHARRTSCSSGLNMTFGKPTTVWSVDAHTQRSSARTDPSSPASAPSSSQSSPMTRPCTLAGQIMDLHDPKRAYDRSGSIASVSRKSSSPHLGWSASSPSNMCTVDESEQEDQDLVWSDMPPTLGLDEWMAYIGAMMMRWLASGQSSPKSTTS